MYVHTYIQVVQFLPEPDICPEIFSVWLGDKPVSNEAKAAFATYVPAILYKAMMTSTANPAPHA